MATTGTPRYALSQSTIQERTFITRVYGWMAAGLVTTAVVAAYRCKSRLGSGLFWVITLPALGIVVVLSLAILFLYLLRLFGPKKWV